MNFKKLENNLLDMIQEQQVKIGYMSGVTRFYYPLQSLNRLLGTELTEEEMQHAMEKFSDHACDRLGKVTASSKNGRFCITLPPQASDYVHENRKPSEFLVRFIGTVARHGCTLDEVMDFFMLIPTMYTWKKQPEPDLIILYISKTGSRMTTGIVCPWRVSI